MAMQSSTSLIFWRSKLPIPLSSSDPHINIETASPRASIGALPKRKWKGIVSCRSSSDGVAKNKGVPNTNYVVPLDNSFSFSSSSCITRPLVEILRDLNKKIPDNIVKPRSSNVIPWYQANRMLSFYAPGWCGEVRDVIFSEDGSVTVVYRLTIRGSDGEAHRESTGTISPANEHAGDAVSAAEELAFCRACARFGLGLYLFHEE